MELRYKLQEEHKNRLQKDLDQNIKIKKKNLMQHHSNLTPEEINQIEKEEYALLFNQTSVKLREALNDLQKLKLNKN